MKYILTLILNETGKRALGQETKELQVDNVDITDITSEYIDKLFPISLVENFYVVPSFLNMKPGEYVYVVDTDGTRYLGMIDTNDYNEKYVYVTIQGDNIPIRGYYSYQTIQFHPNGLEACHYKDKLHLENITPEDVEKEKLKLKNKSYIRLVELLLDSNITVEGEALKQPDWLSSETLDSVLETLENEYNSYFD